jgi:cytochrome c-type biogenesis protein CcmE
MSHLFPHTGDKCDIAVDGRRPCDNPPPVDPNGKRRIRLVVALGTAVLLAAALVYTSFSASTEAKEPSQLLAAAPGASYELTGRVVRGSVTRDAETMRFRVADRDDSSKTIPVTYSGTVPDPFRGGREIILTGVVQRGVFVGEPDTLVTKCPSKFTTENAPDDG